MTTSKSSLEDDFPSGLSQPARRALANADIKNLEQLAGFSKNYIKQLHGIGPKALEQLQQALGERGLAFAVDKRG